jgi:hydroxymethylbilane synthase
MSRYVIGSGSSNLARALAIQLHRLLAQVEPEFPGAAFERREIKTRADVEYARPMSYADPYFHRSSAPALAQVLADGGIDVAVHSLKDVAAAKGRALVLVDPPLRADPRDVLCGHTLAGLPIGARVGTGSPRRAAQLLAVRPDIRIVRIGGTVQPRLGLMVELGLDALLLAAAGLDRLGLSEHITERLDPAAFPPAPGQGALGILVREGSENLEAMLQRVSHPLTTAAIRAERRVLAGLRGTWASPIGAYAVADGEGQLQVHGQVTSLDGSTTLKATAIGEVDRATALGREVAYRLLDQGADLILAASNRALGRVG